MAKLLYAYDHAANIGVQDRQEAEEIIFEILDTHAAWLAGRFGGLTKEAYYEGLVEQFSGNQDNYAYELPLTELRRCGEMDQWTPQPLRLYVSKAWGMPSEEGFPFLVQIRDNGGWDAALEWVPPELR